MYGQSPTLTSGVPNCASSAAIDEVAREREPEAAGQRVARAPGRSSACPSAHSSRNRSASSPRPSCAAAAPGVLGDAAEVGAGAERPVAGAGEHDDAHRVVGLRGRPTASRSPCITPYDIALRRSGRLIVTRATPPSTAYRTSGSAMAGRRSLRQGPLRPTRARRYRGRMLVYVVAIVVAILIVPLTGGQFRQLGQIRLRRPWLLFAGLGLQILLELVDLPRARYDDVGLAILLASYVLIIGFGLSNLLLTGHGRHHRSASR